jgi:hypothetical protein
MLSCAKTRAKSRAPIPDVSHPNKLTAPKGARLVGSKKIPEPI